MGRGVFPILFDEWQTAAAAADEAWADVWCKLDELAASQGRGPSGSAICEAMRLRSTEIEWLRAIDEHLRSARKAVRII